MWHILCRFWNSSIDRNGGKGKCVGNGRFLCTALYPNPFIGQPYAYKLVVGTEETIGTSLPFDNLCLIFE